MQWNFVVRILLGPEILIFLTSDSFNERDLKTSGLNEFSTVSFRCVRKISVRGWTNPFSLISSKILRYMKIFTDYSQPPFRKAKLHVYNKQYVHTYIYI